MNFSTLSRTFRKVYASTLQSYVQRKYRQIIVYLSKQSVIVDKQMEIVNKSEREKGSEQTNGEYKQTNEA